MGNNELAKIGDQNQEQKAELNLYYGKIYNELKEQIFDAQRDGLVNLRNPGGNKTCIYPDIQVGVRQKIHNTEFYISPVSATLDLEHLNKIAHRIALNPDQVSEGDKVKVGRLVKKDGIIFPEVVVQEKIAEIEEQTAFQTIYDPYNRAEELKQNDKLEMAINRTNKSRIQLIQRTRVIVFPTKHLAQLMTDYDPLISKNDE